MTSARRVRGILAASIGALWLQGVAHAAELPDVCRGVDGFVPAERDVRVVAEPKLLDRPRVCAAAAPCPWRHESALAAGDALRELGVVADGPARFACVVDRQGAAGWLSTNYLCLPPQDRPSRDAPLVWPVTDHMRCDARRSIADDRAFYTAHLVSDVGALDLRFEEPDAVHYDLSWSLGGCSLRRSGRLAVESSSRLDGSRLVTEEGDRLLLMDTDATWTLAPGNSACPSSLDFFHDPGGNRVSADNAGGSGCDAGVPGLDKPKLVATLFRLKRAVAAGDRRAVGSLVRYPLRVNTIGDGSGEGSRSRTVRSARDLERDYDRLFDACLVDDVREQRLGDLFCRDQGAMIGAGSLWIQDAGGEAKVAVINQRGCPRR